MAVAFDVSSVGAGTGPSWSHTCSGSNRLLIVATADWVGGDTDTTTGITYNGVALTKLTASKAFNTARSQLWYLVNPASGAHTIAVTSSAGMAFIASSYTGVDQSTPLGTPVANTGNSATPTSGSITGQVGNLLVDNVAVLGGGGALTAGGGRTNMGPSITGGWQCESSRVAGTATPITMGWTGYSGDNRWASSAVEILAAAAGPAVAPSVAALLGVGQ